MAAVTYVCSLVQVANQLGEDLDLLDAIISNDDNLSYGTIVSVQIGPDEYLTALTDEGICELTEMLSDARRTQKIWKNFLQDVVCDPYIIERVKAQGPR